MSTKVTNPLTIIAIFSGLAEAFATVTLAFLPHDIQQQFVIFVMAFPSCLVLIFFGVLVFRHKVLYAPSDYADESNFMEVLERGGELKRTIMSSISATGGDGQPLPTSQLRDVSEKLDRFVVDAARAPRKEQILTFLLTDGPATTVEICTALNLNPTYAGQLLRGLLEEGYVARDDTTGRATRWSFRQISTTAFEGVTPTVSMETVPPETRTCPARQDGTTAITDLSRRS